MLTIRTNHQYRNTLTWYDLTPKEQNEFGWIADSDTVTTEDAEFVRYRDRVYYIGDFMRSSHPDFAGWDGYESDTFFSGILIKYDPEDCERVMMGTFYS